MEQENKTLVEAVFVEECPRLKIGLKLHKQTWEEHIKPFKPVNERHLPLIRQIIRTSDQNQSIWFKINQPNRMCIVRQVPDFLPLHKFILISLLKYSDVTGCITSIYPIDELPNKEKGYKLL